MSVAPQLLASARTTGKDEHNTPPEILDRVRKVGRIAFDPCPGDGDMVGAQHDLLDASEIKGLPAGSLPSSKYGVDGLMVSWIAIYKRQSTHGALTYVNFPYSHASAWALKIVSEADAGLPIIALVAARPDTRWWRAMWNAADAVAFWRGRITFLGSKHPAPFPSALFALNVSQRRFRAAFGDAAEIVCPA